MFTFDPIQCCLMILLMLVVGEYVSEYLKAAVPALLVAGLLYLAGLWAGLLPAGLAETAGFTTFTPVAMMLVILSLGASTSFRQLMQNWRAVALAAGVFTLQIAALLLVIGGLFGLNTVVGGLPGGMATALIVQERARSLGYDSLVLLSTLLLSVQALVAAPIAALCLKREARRLLAEDAPVSLAAVSTPETADAPKPESFYRPLLRLLLGAWLAARIELLTGLSRYVVCLLLGVALGELKFFKKDEMARTQSRGFLMLLMMSAVLSGYGNATPQLLAKMLAPLSCILLCDAVSILVFSVPLGRLLGFSPAMSIAIGMNVMLGFPMNLLISEEAIGVLTEDPEQVKRLTDRISTPMIIGGFTSTTFLAVLAAGLLAGLMR